MTRSFRRRNSGGGSSGLISSGISWDSGAPANANYLGSSKLGSSSLFIDNSGAAFDLISVAFASTGEDDAFEMISSKGGVYNVPHTVGTLDVSFSDSDPLWNGIDWLMFGYHDAGLPTVGLQQLVLDPPVFAVDKPATLATFGLGLIGLIALRRNRATAQRAAGV